MRFSVGAVAQRWPCPALQRTWVRRGGGDREGAGAWLGAHLHDVYKVGLDVIEQPLLVRHHQRRRLVALEPVHRIGHLPQRIDIQTCRRPPGRPLAVRQCPKTAQEPRPAPLVPEEQCGVQVQRRPEYGPCAAAGREPCAASDRPLRGIVPESISSRIATSASSTASCRISFLFFSPPAVQSRRTSQTESSGT